MHPPLETLSRAIGESFPKAKCELDPAEHPGGESFLDVSLGEFFLVVSHDPATSTFGISEGDGEYGEGPGKTLDDFPTVLRRVRELLEKKP